jgi:hypothetical protein
MPDVSDDLHSGGPTQHLVVQGDARDLSFIPSKSVHLVVTSSPYAMLKEYHDVPGQLGNMPVYEEFLNELDRVRLSDDLSVIVHVLCVSVTDVDKVEGGQDE